MSGLDGQVGKRVVTAVEFEVSKAERVAKRGCDPKKHVSVPCYADCMKQYPWKQSAMALRVMSRQRLRAHIAYLYDLLAMYERNDEANRERAVDLSLGLVSFEAGGQYFFTYVLSQVHARNRMEQVHVLTGHPVKNFGVLYECEDEVQRLSQRSYGEIWVADDPLGRGLKPFLEGIGASLD